MNVKTSDGTVDLSRPENIRRGMVFCGATDERVVAAGERSGLMWETPKGTLFTPAAWRFVGIDWRYADDESVRRFCCGDLMNGTKGNACTLAVGHGGERHEDIARNTKWPAAPIEKAFAYPISLPGPGTRVSAWSSTDLAPWPAKEMGQPCPVPSCGKCGSAAQMFGGNPLMWSVTNDAGRASAPICEGCRTVLLAEPNGWTIRAGKIERRQGFQLSGIDPGVRPPGLGAVSACKGCGAGPASRKGCRECRPPGCEKCGPVWDGGCYCSAACATNACEVLAGRSTLACGPPAMGAAAVEWSAWFSGQPSPGHNGFTRSWFAGLLGKAGLQGEVSTPHPGYCRVEVDGADAALCCAMTRFLSDIGSAGVQWDVVRREGKNMTTESVWPEHTKALVARMRQDWFGRLETREDNWRSLLVVAHSHAHGDYLDGLLRLWLEDRGLALVSWAYVSDIDGDKTRLRIELQTAPDGCLNERSRAGKAKRERQGREAPLVALVNNVPQWANPVAWRAAILAVHESKTNGLKRGSAVDAWDDNDTEWLRENVGKPCDLPHWCSKRPAHDAYTRALLKHKTPEPERKRAKGLPLDCDWDLEEFAAGVR